MLRLLPPVALIVLACAGCGARPPLHGTPVAHAQPARAVTLTDQRGLRTSFGGRSDHFTALYFGLTHCTDVCPQTLRALSNARARAGIPEARLRIVMVTVDPAHDTPAAMREFFSKTSVHAIGLTGPPAALQQLYHRYGVAVQAQKHDVAHSGYVYVLDPEGRLREIIDPSTSPAAIAQDFHTVAG